MKIENKGMEIKIIRLCQSRFRFITKLEAMIFIKKCFSIEITPLMKVSNIIFSKAVNIIHRYLMYTGFVLYGFLSKYECSIEVL